MSDDSSVAISHEMKTEGELVAEYQRLRAHLEVFWMYRPRNKALMSAFPDTVAELDRRVSFFEDILQVPEDERFDYEEFDQNETR